tara:strand:+ start:1139 stop:1552 length:414 start_codon:yes stop_codon:yes gene_type:complete
MASQFPTIRPTTRSFSMGDYPSKTYRSLSGAIFKRAFGNKATGYRMDLTFKNIGDTEELRSLCGSVKVILDHYDSVDGTFDKFNLPNRVFEGMNTSLRGVIQAPSNISWRYSRPPQVQSVRSGISTVNVSLIGEIDA